MGPKRHVSHILILYRYVIRISGRTSVYANGSRYRFRHEHARIRRIAIAQVLPSRPVPPFAWRCHRTDGDAGLVPASGDGWLADWLDAQSIVFEGSGCETLKA